MKKITLYCSVSLLLAACSSMVDHQSVLMTVKTPGAENAKCILENEDMKYVAYTDEEIEVKKSPHDLVVRCMAPGNREKTVHVKREINDWVFANVANGFVPGAAYDYFGRGGFDYPNVVTVSFVGEPLKPYPLPKYEAQDLQNGNYKGKIESYGSGVIVSEGTRYDSLQDLQKKETVYYNATDFFSSEPAVESASPAVSYDPTEEDK